MSPACPQAICDQLHRAGAGGDAFQDWDAHYHRKRSQDGGHLCQKPVQYGFSRRIVFLDVNEAVGSFTGDRTEFLGRNGNMTSPAALARERLSNRVGAALDPCAAMQVEIDLADKQEREIIFTLGVGRDHERRSQLNFTFSRVWSRARRGWRLCGATGTAPLAQCTWRPGLSPQTCCRTAGFSTRPIACRIWARSG